MHKKTIYIIYTGGTIGMRRSTQGYIPVKGYLQQQLQQMPRFHRPEMPNFVIHEYQTLIDSSDMSPAIWQQIAKDIQDNYTHYDGFVILQGTDTMAFTASALSFMLENLAKPVLITGAQIPLSELRSDGQSNLLNALYLAAHHPINEVGLFFDQKLFRGTRATKAHADGFSAFTSPNFPPLVETGIHIRKIQQALPVAPLGELIIHAMSPQTIAIITLYPGLENSFIQGLLNQPIKALILRTYGLGNAPRCPDFLRTIEELTARDILVINITQCLSGRVDMQSYANGRTLTNVGVVSGFDMTLEATVAKLHYLLNQSLPIQQLREAMVKNLRGELTQETENSHWGEVA
jgi:L-asparaginase